MQGTSARRPTEAVEENNSARLTSCNDPTAFGSVEASSSDTPEVRSESTLSNISKITIQSNNNARITTGQRSNDDDNDDDDDESSTQVIFNRSLLSSLGTDSQRCKSEQSGSTDKNNTGGLKRKSRIPRPVTKKNKPPLSTGKNNAGIAEGTHCHSASKTIESKGPKSPSGGKVTYACSELQEVKEQGAKAGRLSNTTVTAKSIGAETRILAQTVTSKSETKRATSLDKISEPVSYANANKTLLSKHHCSKEKVRQRLDTKKTNPGRRPYISEIDAYCALQAEVNEAQKKIDENQSIIIAQEKEMDEEYEDVRERTDKLLETTHDMIDARKIHANFKDEATRIRVHHKTNLVAADIYEMETIALQEQITEMQQQITELKAINRLTPEELKDKIQIIQAYDEAQKQRNSDLEEYIETLKNILNEIRCESDYKRNEIKTTDNAFDSETEDQQNYKIHYEAAPTVDLMNQEMEYSSKIQVSCSKSADTVSERQNGLKNGLRETTSTHSHKNIYQSSINSAKGFLKSRRQNSRKPYKNEDFPFYTKPLLHKRRPQGSVNNLMFTCSKFDPNHLDQPWHAPYFPLQTDPRLDEKMLSISATKRPPSSLSYARDISTLFYQIPKPPATIGPNNTRHFQYPPACPWPDGMDSFFSARHKPHPPPNFPTDKQEYETPLPPTYPRTNVKNDPVTTSHPPHSQEYTCPDVSDSLVSPHPDDGDGSSSSSPCTSVSESSTPESAASHSMSTNPPPDDDEVIVSESSIPDVSDDKDNLTLDCLQSPTIQYPELKATPVQEKANTDDKESQKLSHPLTSDPDEKEGSLTACHVPKPPTSSRTDNQSRRKLPANHKPTPVKRPGPDGRVSSTATNRVPHPPECLRPDNETPRVPTDQTANRPSNQSSEKRNKPGQRRNERLYSPEVTRLSPCHETVTVNDISLGYI